MSKNLVELMAAYLKKWHNYDFNDWTDEASDLLNIVKEHISEVAEVCPECGGSGLKVYTPKGISGQQVVGQECFNCKGSGVIARTEGEV